MVSSQPATQNLTKVGWSTPSTLWNPPKDGIIQRLFARQANCLILEFLPRLCLVQCSQLATSHGYEASIWTTHFPVCCYQCESLRAKHISFEQCSIWFEPVFANDFCYYFAVIFSVFVKLGDKRRGAIALDNSMQICTVI